MRKSRLAVLLAISVLIVPGSAWLVYRHAGVARQTKAHYIKFEYRIPMRDGVAVFTQVYLPRDQTKTYPFLIQRTPFGVTPYGVGAYRPQLGASPEFDRAGYIFVFQDVRGRFQSGGEFLDMRPHIDQPAAGQIDESTDVYDTVEWLLKNVPSNNGKVGIWGMSYQGFYTSASVIDSHPAIKAASIQAPMTDLFLGDDAYHNGVFQLAAQFVLYSNFFKPRSNASEFPSPQIGSFFDYQTSDGYEFFLKHGPNLPAIAALAKNPLLDENIRHDTYDDYWKARDISQHLHTIHCPVLTVGGWFDAQDLAGTFRTYHAITGANPGPIGPFVMGPWGHGDWLRTPGRKLGGLDFGSDTGLYFRTRVLFPYFEHYLKDVPVAQMPTALAFETGTNQWRQYPSWPPPGAQPSSLYLRANGRLSFEPPTEQENLFDEYVSDPANPVPYVEHPPTDLDETYMYGDQRFATGRADVLTYRSDPLTQDLTVAGPIAVRLQVSSSGTDSDFIVKLIDEDASQTLAPGYQRLVRGEPMRAKFRNSFSNPESLRPNEVTALNYAMADINHTFLRGHHLVVQVQSSWFPLTDLNPQRFMSIPDAKHAEFFKATQRVYHRPQAASSLVLHVLKRQRTTESAMTLNRHCTHRSKISTEKSSVLINRSAAKTTGDKN